MDISMIKKVVAASDNRVYFELENGSFASADCERDNSKVLLFTHYEMFAPYLSYADEVTPTEEQIATARENYYNYASTARFVFSD